MSMDFAFPLWLRRAPAACLAVLLLGFLAIGAHGEETEETEEISAEVQDEIVVVATRSRERALEVPAQVSTVDLERLTDEGFYAGADELRGQPGVFFRRGEGDNDAFLLVNFRGVTGNHGNDTFLALVDGIPFISGDEEVLMSEIPYAAVDSLEIVRGPVSALYGRGGIAGAVSYSLYSPARTRTEVRLAGGSDEYFNGRLNLGRQLDDSSLFLSVDGLSAEGWRENNRNRRVNGFGRWVQGLGQGTSLSAYVNYTDRDSRLGSVIPTLADGTLVDVAGGREAFLGSREQRSDSRSLMSALRLNTLLGPDLLVEATAHYRDRSKDNVLDFYDFFGFDPSRNVLAVNGFDTFTEEDTFFLETTASWSLRESRILGGVSYERTDIEESDFWSGQFGFTPECGFAFYLIEIDYSTGQVLNRDHPCFVVAQHNLSGETENAFLGAFLQTELELGERLKLTVGARYDEFRRDTSLITGPERTVQPTVEDREDNISPKLALVYTPSSQQAYYFNFGEGFSSNFGPIWQWDPSTFIRDTRPTTLRSYELGTKGLLWNNRLSYSLAAYFIDQRDRLVFLDNPAAFDDFTAPSTIATTGQEYRSQGLEMTAAYRFRGGASLELRYGFVDAEWERLVLQTFSGPLDLSGNAPTGVPENTVYLGWRQPIGQRFDFNLAWELYDDYAITQDNRFTGGGHDLASLALSYRPELEQLDRVQLAVTNLFDEEYYYLFGGSRSAVTQATPGVPRQVRLTLGWTF